ANWYEAHWEEMEPVTETKRKALLAYKASPCPSTLKALRATSKNSQQTARHCTKAYWLNLCSSIQTAADAGDARGMYKGIKKAIGPKTTKIAPLKSRIGKVITDQEKQLLRWVKYYLELYATQNIVTDTTLDTILDLPVMEELDTPPTLDELSKVTDCLACGNAPGSNGILPEVLKNGKLVVVGRATIDMIFSVRQLQEKSREQQMPLYIAFIDLTKAFDLVSRSGLFRLLQKIGCSPQLLAVVTSFHDNIHSTVVIFFSMLLHYAFKDCREGVYIYTRADGKLFNIARLHAKTKVTEILIHDMLFANDAALTTHTEDGLQQLVNCFSYACKKFGLTISLKKTKVMAQKKDSPPTIAIDGYNLECVENFTYLGSIIINSLSIDMEINGRIAKAATVMARLNQRVWNNTKPTVKTKLPFYKACVFSTLLYSSETWTTHLRHEKKLNSFHVRCLRRILPILWQDKVPNTEVLESAGIRSMSAILSEKHLRWLGHVRRMGPSRIPRDLLYSKLAEGSRQIGRP
ncbi:hypothetical protein M9458_029401, partial [Cirrhinus mrigala]